MYDHEIKRWEETRDIARAITDDKDRAAALQKVYDQRDKMMMTCIAHQGGRCKELQADNAKIKSDLEAIRREMKPMKETCDSVEKAKLKFSGAKAFIEAAKAGGWISVGVGLFKLLFGG